ncbi:prefoldin subunit beta [Candidatus Woesearchaeota archaeon]|nr:prefoldin subunit beta [Candidatus Woesearchaeota archaeon]
MAEDNKEMEEKIAELQMIEQNLQQLLSQKQNIQVQQIETENALEELKKQTTKEVYKIVGQILINSDKKEVEKDLNSKKEIFLLKIKNIEKQEEKLREKAKEMQREILDKMNKK